MREGRVFKRGSSWAFTVDVNPPGAPRQQRSKAGFATKALALQGMHDVQESVVVGRYIAPSRLTVGHYLLEMWLPAVRSSVRPSTWDSYESYLRLHVVPRIGDQLLQTINRGQLRILYGQLEQSGRLRAPYGGLSRKTVHNIHITLLKAFGDAVEDQLMVRNPAIRAHRADNDRPPMRTWNALQARRFLNAVGDDRLFGLWRLAISTGMRRAELCGVRWEDVNLEHQMLAVVQTRLKAGGTTYFAGPKTQRSRRTIALDDVTVDVLRRHKVRQSAERLALGPAYDDHDLLFCFADGKPLDPDGLGLRFQRHIRESGLPRIRFHDLRHTHATLGLAAGVHAKVMQERLGHSSVAFTLDIYSHALPTMQTDAADKMARLLDGLA